MSRTQRDPHKLRRLRQIVQIVFLVGLGFLLAKALFGRVLGSRVPILIVSGSVALLTLVLGRVWCGWACPMGTILYWTRFKKAAKGGRRLSGRWRAVKYVLLVVILAAALFGLARPALDWIGQNAATAGSLLLLVLVASVALNLAADLFWCRCLCPLGARWCCWPELQRLLALREGLPDGCDRGATRSRGRGAPRPGRRSGQVYGLHRLHDGVPFRRQWVPVLTAIWRTAIERTSGIGVCTRRVAKPPRSWQGQQPSGPHLTSKVWAGGFYV